MKITGYGFMTSNGLVKLDLLNEKLWYGKKVLIWSGEVARGLLLNDEEVQSLLYNVYYGSSDTLVMYVETDSGVLKFNSKGETTNLSTYPASSVFEELRGLL